MWATALRNTAAAAAAAPGGAPAAWAPAPTVRGGVWCSIRAKPLAVHSQMAPFDVYVRFKAQRLCRSASSSALAAAFEPLPPQPYDYFCVLDFEATCEAGRRNGPNYQVTHHIWGWPRLWANFETLIGISNQNSGPTFQFWANPVNFCCIRRK
jgi:hypothetical protein